MRKGFFDVQRWWVATGIVPESGPCSKDLRDLYLEHILSMTFMTAGAKAPTRTVTAPLEQQRREARNG